MVNGNVKPLSVNSELLEFPEVTVTAAPVAFRVAGKLEFVPTTTFPKFRLDGFTESCPAGVPVPDNGITRLGLEASETMVRFPLTVPDDCGAKITLKVT